MKKTILLASLFSAFAFSLFGQDQLVDVKGDHYSYEANPPVKKIFLRPMVKPVNSATPSLHPLLGSGWTLDTDCSDEFNGSSLDENKWIVNFKWGNTYLGHLAHNVQKQTNGTYPNHQFDGNNLILKNIAGNYTQRMVGYFGDNDIQTDGKKNLRQLPYTSAMIESAMPPKNVLNQPYGFIEIRCKIPRSKYIMANFWLWSAGTDANNKTFYNEIDMFETNDGITMHQTTHYNMAPDTKWYHHHQIVWPEDASFFSEEMNTYAVKWEPNKIIYYLNNKVVRIITAHVPEHKMDIIADMAFRAENGPLSPLDMNSQYTIDYIRVFHRSDYTQSDPVFYVNEKISTDFNNPILIDETSPVLLNGEESYSINNNYTISVQEVNASNVPVGALVTGSFFDNPANPSIFPFNLKSFSQSIGLIANKKYRVKLITSNPAGPATEKVQYIKITPHVNLLDYSINNSTSSLVTVKNKLSYQDLPRIILNGSKSALSGDDFYVSIRLSNSTGADVGPVVEKWYLDQPDKLKEFDLRNFATSEGSLTLEYGKYYKVNLCTGNPWTCGTTKLIYIEPCTNSIDFEINGVKTEPVTVTCEYNEPDITLTTALCTSCFSDDYFISVQKSNSNGAALGSEVSDWMIPPNEFSHVATKIDLRAFTSSRGLNLLNGNYYLVKVATGNPWTERSKLLYISPCTSNPDFTINGSNGTIANPVQIDCKPDPKDLNVRLIAWNGRSCDNYYYLSLWNCNSVGSCTEIAGHWLPTNLVDDMKSTDNPSLAYYDLYNHFKNAPFNTTLSSTNYYKIMLCTGYDGWKCKEVYIHMNQGTCRLSDLTSTSVEDASLTPKFEVYPNPTTGKFQIKFDAASNSDKHIVLINYLGVEIMNTIINNDDFIIDLSEKANGLYIIKVEVGGIVQMKKIVKN